MTDDNGKTAPRLYGEPDDGKPEVDNSNGLRGEGAASAGATSTRRVDMNGHEVDIKEDSGPAQVEADRQDRTT
ncbi:MAG: hypothetical protein INR68_19030 [Methylobacterium mesophilicum]|nr:hypothetical protein [Methylobacterium mesophilicum]